MSFADKVASNARGALAAQHALHDLQTDPAAEHVLITTLFAHDRWRTDETWLRGFLRQIEKAVR